MSAALFAISGAAVGLVEAMLLARRGPDVLSFLARLALVAAMLVVAARAGHLLSGAAGWAAGFGIAATAAYRRLP